MIKPVTKFDAYSGQKGIILTWVKSANATKYNIYRKTGQQKYKLIKLVGNVSTYVDTTAKSGTGYTYYIIAANNKEVSKSSQEDYEYYIGTPIVIFANNNPPEGILIQWNKINGADSYRVIKHNGTKATVIATINTLSYLDKDVKHANEYTYSIQAIHPTTKITYSSAHPLYKSYFIAKPTGVKVTVNGLKVTVSWDLDTKMSGQNIHWTQNKSFQKEGRTSIMVENTKEKSKTFTVKPGTIYVRTQRYLYKNGKRYWGAFSDIVTLNIKADNNIVNKRSIVPKKNSGNIYSLKINTKLGEKTYKCYRQGSFGTSEAGKWLANHGCGVCAFVTAAQPFSKKLNGITPKTFYEKFLKNKQYGTISQAGSIGYGIMSKFLKDDGIKTEIVQNYTLNNAIKDITNHLKTGQPVVITVRSKAFLGNNKIDKKYTNYAHYIALLGMTEDEKVIAADSSKHLWSLDGTSQERFKIGNLKDILEHTKAYSNSSTSMWYSDSGSNGYIKIYV